MGTIKIPEVFKEIADHMPKIYNFAKISVYYSLDNDKCSRMLQAGEKKTLRNGKSHGFF